MKWPKFYIFAFLDFRTPGRSKNVVDCRLSIVDWYRRFLDFSQLGTLRVWPVEMHFFQDLEAFEMGKIKEKIWRLDPSKYVFGRLS